jgi:hypothetical protein
MSIVLRCHDCERRIELPARPEGGKITCPSCRTVLTVPEPGEEEAVDPTTAYAGPQLKRCPQCEKEMPAEGVLCINCGYNFKTGKVTKKVVRVKSSRHHWWFGPIPFYYVNGRAEKTKQGESLAAVTVHVLGIPLGTTQVDLRNCHEIWTDFRSGFGIIGWAIMIGLLLLCLVPGFFWWVWALNKPTYIVRLAHGKNSALTLYEGMSETAMRGVLDALEEMAPTLKIVRK